MDRFKELLDFLIKDTAEPTLVFGTIATDADGDFIEVFLKIKKPEDLPNIRILELRHRMNSHRKYSCFYFKTNKFEELNFRLNFDNRSFARFIREMDSIKYISI